MKIVELFAGYGSQALALRNLGIEFTSDISEIDKYAIKAYNQIHGETRNYGDITKIESLDYYDLWTYSSPCFTADSLVLTEHNGYKQIADIQTGEMVLTHDGTFKSVENVINNGVKPTVKIYGMGFDEIHTTENHKFYVREKAKIWNNLRRSYDRVFSNPVWKQAIDLTRNDYLGFPVNKKSVIPEWNGITFVWSDGRSNRYKNEISKYFENDNFWWIVGRYVADGYVRNNGGIILSCGKKKLEQFKNIADSLGIKYSFSEERTVYKFRYSLKEMELFVKPFGKYAHGKKIPSFVFDLPVQQLKSFLDGYMAGDGCFTNKKFKATSVSRELVYGLAQCVAKVYKRPFSIYKTKRAKTTVIEGRIINQRDTYELTFNKENHVQDKAFYENGCVWYPFNKIEKAENEVVYDLTVSGNHSFVVNNAIVHNCQDFSTAGKQKGIYNADGSLTRSGLLKHVERLLTDSVLFGTQPKYLLMENVKGLVSKKFKPNFLKWLDKLEELGYNNYWQVLNAKDYGIPQNRERVFVVSIRKDVDTKGYKFPSPVPLEKRLKDMLEPWVDVKYYLSDDKVAKFLQNGNTNPSGKGINGNVCTGDICNTLTTNKGEGLKIKDVSNTIRCGGGSLDGKHTWDIVVEPLCAASRGRNPDNSSDRTAGSPTEQRLEINYSGCTNTLTSVQKDNYIVEPFIADDTQGFDGVRYYDNYSPTLRSQRSGLKILEPKVIQIGNIVSTGNWDNPQRGRIYSYEGCPPALNCVGGGGLEPKILEENIKNYRIRKLTPRECFRLMGVKDEQFDRLSGISDSQLYKLAGNSIVVNVLETIFRNLFIETNIEKTGQLDLF